MFRILIILLLLTSRCFAVDVKNPPPVTDAALYDYLLYMRDTFKNILDYGEIYAKDNTTQITLNSAAKVQVTIFDTNGESENMTPDHTQDHITVNKRGKYLVTISTAVVNVAAQAHVITLIAYINDGITSFDNLHAHRDLTGGGGDKASISISGIINLAVGDTIELWADTDDAGDRNVIFEDITLSVVLLGVL